MKAIPLLVLLLLSGCVGNSLYDLDMPTSALSSEITNSSKAVHVKPNHSSNFHGDMSASVRSSHSNFTGVGGGLDDPDHFRFILSKRNTKNPDGSEYKVNGGYELSVAGTYNSKSEIRVAIHVNDADFISSKAEGFSHPYFLGADLGALVSIAEVGNINFVAGGQLSLGILEYEFKESISVGSEEFKGDSIGIFGVGIPFGLHMDIGYLSLEALAAPTLYFHDFDTHIGFKNDLGFARVKAPISIGLGFNF